MFSPFGWLVLIALSTFCIGSLKQCASETKRAEAKLCYEQTKDVKCWGLNETP